MTIREILEQHCVDQGCTCDPIFETEMELDEALGPEGGIAYVNIKHEDDCVLMKRKQARYN